MASTVSARSSSSVTRTSVTPAARKESAPSGKATSAVSASRPERTLATAQQSGGARQVASANPLAAGLRSGLEARLSTLRPVMDVRKSTVVPSETGGGDTRTPAAAAAEARTILNSGGSSVGTTSGVGGQVVQDPASATDRAAQAQAASDMVQKNADLEKAALDKLPKDQQEQYQRVRDATVAAKDPAATLSMQTMLLEGKLPGQDSLAGNPKANLLTQLDKLTTQPLAKDLEGTRNTLVAQVVSEVATPTGINQGNVGTCGATSVIQQLATQNPAEYVRLVAGLSSPEGQVAMANGDVLKREPGTFGPDTAEGRTPSQFLMGPAVMEYANGALIGYDSANDQSVLPFGAFSYGGLFTPQIAHAAAGLFGKPFTDTDTQWLQRTLGPGFLLGPQKSPGQQAIDAVVAGNTPVMVGMSFDKDGTTPGIQGNDGHCVSVTGVGTNPDGSRYVEIVNPWGQVERVPEETFKERVQGAAIPRP